MNNEEILRKVATGKLSIYEANDAALVLENRFPSPPQDPSRMRLITLIGKRN
jgi:hypothetical protein